MLQLIQKLECQSGNQGVWRNGYPPTYENTECNENMVSARPRYGEITFKGFQYAIWIKCLIFPVSLQSLLASITYRSFPSFWLRVDEPAKKPANFFSCQFFCQRPEGEYMGYLLLARIQMMRREMWMTGTRSLIVSVDQCLLIPDSCESGK